MVYKETSSFKLMNNGIILHRHYDKVIIHLSSSRDIFIANKESFYSRHNLTVSKDYLEILMKPSSDLVSD